MKKALVLLAPGFEEIETITVVDILRRAGIDVTMAGTIDGPIIGSRRIRVMADISMDQALDRDFNMVVLPGGQPGTKHLGKDPRVKKILDHAVARETSVSAICAAPSILNMFGFLSGKKATSHPSVRSMMEGVDYSEDRVVVDGNWITSRSPGTAMEFAFCLVEHLVGKEKAKELNKGVMARL